MTIGRPRETTRERKREKKNRAIHSFRRHIWVRSSSSFSPMFIVIRTTIICWRHQRHGITSWEIIKVKVTCIPQPKLLRISRRISDSWILKHILIRDSIHECTTNRSESAPGKHLIRFVPPELRRKVVRKWNLIIQRKVHGQWRWWINHFPRKQGEHPMPRIR